MYPSPPHEPRGIARHYVRGGTILPSTSLLSVLSLLLAFILIVMAGIFFAEGSPGIGIAFIATVAALGYGFLRSHRNEGV